MSWLSSKVVWCLAVNAALLPIYAVLALVAFACATLPINPTIVCRRNLSRRYGSNFLKIWIQTVGVYLNYGIYFFEALIFWKLSAVLVTNQEEYNEFLSGASTAFGLKESKQGFLFLGGHYCVIEQIGDMMNQFLRKLHVGEVNVLYKPSPFPILGWVLDTYRKSRKFRAIPTGDSKRLRADIEDVFLRGDSLALVADQKPKKGGVFLDFFGAYAGFPSNGIQQALNHPVVAVANTARRIFPGCFRIEYALMPNEHLQLSDPNALRTCIDSIAYTPSLVWDRSGCELRAGTNTVAVLSHYVGWLEAVIRLSPVQWCWDYRKWSRQPD